MIRSVEELRTAIADRQTFAYLFFWGHRPRKDGTIGTGCLSQWWMSDFELDGQRYTSAEQYMMAEKARLFDDAEVLAQILDSHEPRFVKALGRKVRGFDEARWGEARFDIVVRASTAKFGQNEELGAFLRGTGDKVLVEASPTDRIWGIGLAAKDDRAQDPATWRGKNLLGFALMAARDALH